ncbi:MAG: hemerythrin domain-containing protein [Betaproteobacteria bacterium]|nr:hemerythrin domain-containing protein [Betaproteobacteria bacterium]
MAKTKRGRKAAKRGRKAAKAPDAVELLKKDHAEVKKAFKQFEKAKYKDPNALHEFVATICNDLTIHTRLEEEIFYPAVRAKIKDDDLMNEALVEHNSAKTLIADIQKLRADDPMFKPSVTVLAEYVQHHAREEEREMLPKAKRLKLDLAGLADEMLVLRDQLKAR